MKLLLVVAMMLAPAARADTGSVLSASLFSASELSLAVDALQTMAITRGPEKQGHRWESNPILGIKPSDSTVLLYFGGIAAANAAVYALAPQWASNIVSGGVLAVEIPTIARNHFACGVRIHF